MEINQVVNHPCARQGKINKKQAFEHIKHLVETLDEKHITELAELYSFFLPPMPKKPKTKEQWLNKAVAKFDVRYYLNNAHHDGKKLCGTDGHRLHFIKGYKAKEGFYNSEMEHLDNSTNTFGKYPDVDRVIPSYDKLENLGVLNVKDLEKAIAAPDGKNIPYYRIESGEKFVNIQVPFLDDAVSFMEEPCFYIHVDHTDTSSILIEDKNGLSAVVMALRV